jgi:hypothetical protein
MPNRLSDWITAHPVLWAVGLGLVLVVVGFALDLPPVVVVAAGAVLAGLNVLHAWRRGYCPAPGAKSPENSRIPPGGVERSQR